MFEFFDIFEICSPENEEQISETRVNNIKASVLSRISQIEEEKPMKKHFSIKPFVIAAAVMTTGAVSVLGASAATNKNVSDRTVPITITYQQTDSVEISENMAGVSYTYEALGEIGTIELTEKDIYEVKLGKITLSDGEEWTETDTSTAVTTRFVKRSDEEWAKDWEIIYKKIDENGAAFFETAGAKVVYETIDSLEFTGKDADGTMHYKSRYSDGEVSLWHPDGVNEDDLEGIVVCGTAALNVNVN